ncbi:TPA: hypothetical protein H1005_03695 [archaeon]|uniref:ECF transporter S component n=1 Tax=Candidatus Naiadarchaeum limnaeum TaxID=2756139 RepID=A0A832V1C1_9ARCH|nr:hypothetical protein [Candidatus Naiadarchaeales archaeon SRR2090153.bin1042]HIK00373.1 hypothetical protein [Candidatus Naiadarchaeum limnaeum]
MAKAKRYKAQLPLTKDTLKYLAVTVAALIFIAYIITTTRFTLRDFGIVVGFILIGAAARFPERFMPVALGIELISVFTIVSSIRYGSLVGAIVGAAAFTLSGYFTIERPQDVLVAALGFIGIAYFAPLSYAFFAQNLGLTAIALTVGYDVFTGFFYFFMGYGIVSVVRFSVVHIIANYLIIIYLGAKLLGI